MRADTGADTGADSALRTAVSGRVLLPGDAGFAAAARPWNLAVEQPVAAVVEATDADDVAAVVRYARRTGRAVAAQTTGHGAAPGTDGAILLRTRRLDAVEVRPELRLARVGAGVTWDRVLAAAAPYRLTGLAGSSPVVGVAGYTLSGGLSWYGRAHGWAADAVTAFEVVDADGGRARVTAETDPELFWALRGGGGDFAIVTALEFELVPAPDLYGGSMAWPLDRADEVAAPYLEITAQAPPALSAWLGRVNIPGVPPAVTVSVAFLGTAEEARDLLKPLDAIPGAVEDTRRPLDPAELGAITGDPVDPMPSATGGELLAGLDEAALRGLLHEPIDPLAGLQLRHLGGALAEERPGRGACGTLAEPYLLYTYGAVAGPEQAAAIRERQRSLAAALGDLATGRRPYICLGAGETVAHTFPAATVDRLRRIKRERDPHGVILANHPVAH